MAILRTIVRPGSRLFAMVAIGALVLDGRSTANAGDAEVVIRAQPGAKAEDVDKLRRSLDATRVTKLSVDGAEVWKLPEGKVADAKAEGHDVLQYVEEKHAPTNTLFVGAATADLTPKQQAVLAQIGKEKFAVGTVVLRLDAAQFKADMLKDARTDVTLALGDAKTVEAKPSRSVVRAENDLTWYGTVDGAPGIPAGDAVLVVRDKNVTGTVRTGTETYQIRALGGGLHAVSKVDPKGLPPDHPPSFDEKTTKPADDGTSGDVNGGAAADHADQPNAAAGTREVEILVAYTPAVDTAVADVPGLIRLAVDVTNQSYVNSGVNVRLRLVGTTMVAYAESDSFDTDLGRFRNRTDGHMDDFHNLKDSTGADVAVLFTTNPEACGLASAIMALPDEAFAAVNHGCAVDNYSFGHEIGHLQGARHDRCVDPTDQPYVFGHGYVPPSKTWRTVMAYANCCASCPRVPYWSNPNVQHQGEATGTTTEDNARVLNTTALTVAGFRGIPVAVADANQPPAGSAAPAP